VKASAYPFYASEVTSGHNATSYFAICTIPNYIYPCHPELADFGKGKAQRKPPWDGIVRVI